MFADASAFNGNISGWDVSQGTSFVSILHYNCLVFILMNLLTIILFCCCDMFQSVMFVGASAFNGDISGWDVSQCRDFVSILHYNCFVFIFKESTHHHFYFICRLIRFMDSCC